LSERLGALSMRALVGKFLSDLSAPITDHNGEIYLYKGDGLIAIWNWRAGLPESWLRKGTGPYAGLATTG
jgi:class 3 adenylate cyclase